MTLSRAQKQMWSEAALLLAPYVTTRDRAGQSQLSPSRARRLRKRVRVRAFSPTIPDASWKPEPRPEPVDTGAEEDLRELTADLEEVLDEPAIESPEAQAESEEEIAPAVAEPEELPEREASGSPEALVFEVPGTDLEPEEALAPEVTEAQVDSDGETGPGLETAADSEHEARGGFEDVPAAEADTEVLEMEEEPAGVAAVAPVDVEPSAADQPWDEDSGFDPDSGEDSFEDQVDDPAAQPALTDLSSQVGEADRFRELSSLDLSMAATDFFSVVNWANFLNAGGTEPAKARAKAPDPTGAEFFSLQVPWATRGGEPIPPGHDAGLDLAAPVSSLQSMGAAATSSALKAARKLARAGASSEANAEDFLGALNWSVRTTSHAHQS